MPRPARSFSLSPWRTKQKIALDGVCLGRWLGIDASHLCGPNGRVIAQTRQNCDEAALQPPAVVLPKDPGQLLQNSLVGSTPGSLLVHRLAFFFLSLLMPYCLVGNASFRLLLHSRTL